MRRLIFFILVLIVAVWAGLLLRSDPGYVLLSYSNWTMEMSLWFAIVALLFSFLLLHWLIQFINFSSLLPQRLQRWFSRRRMRKANQIRNSGLIALAEGNWKVAEKNLVSTVKYSKSPLINYLAAAMAAQGAGDYAKRDEYLQLAHAAKPSASLAIGLTQAQLQILQKQQEQAVASLKHLHEIDPQHPYVLKMLQKLLKEVCDWHGIKELLPELRKNKILSADEFATLELQTYKHLLHAASNKDKGTVDAVWNNLSRHLRNDAQLIEVYANYLVKNYYHVEAEKILHAAIKNHWQDNLVYLYGKLAGADIKYQFATAEKWLKYHKNDATLFLTLGRLAIANKLWGKARSYLEMSLALKPSAEPYYELGLLHEQLQEPVLAKDAYRKALEVAPLNK